MRLKICQTTLPPPHLLLPLALPAQPISPIPPLQPAAAITRPSSSPSPPFSNALSYLYPSPPTRLLSLPTPSHHKPPPPPPLSLTGDHHSPLHLLLTNPIPSPTTTFSSRPRSTESSYLSTQTKATWGWVLLRWVKWGLSQRGNFMAATLKLLSPAFSVQRDVALSSPHLPSRWPLSCSPLESIVSPGGPLPSGVEGKGKRK